MRNIPINDRKKRPVGVAFPITPTESSFFKLNYTTAEQIKNNLRLFLLTGEFDRIMLTVRGVNLYQFLFENGFDESLISDTLTDKIGEYFPGIKIENITVNKDEHNIQINLSYSILYLQETDNLTLTINA